MMTRLSFGTLLLILGTTVLALILSIIAIVSDSNDDDDDDGSIRFCIKLIGSEEFPGPGDPDGLAIGTLHINKKSCDISWWLLLGNLEPPFTGFHIHGPLSFASPQIADIFIFLTTDHETMVLEGSTHVDESKLEAILKTPTLYYLNLHNKQFPGGAVRGSLFSIC